MLLLLPVLVISAAWLGRSISGTLSGIHPTVSLAQEIKWENDQGRKTNSEESQAFHSSGIPAEQLFQDAGEIQRQFRLGSSLTGAFLGLVLALALLKTAVLKKQKNYEPDKANCVSCGRCYRYCPVGKANSVSL
jgi:ferredoxin